MHIIKFVFIILFSFICENSVANEKALLVEYYSLNRYTEEQSTPSEQICHLVIGDSISYFRSILDDGIYEFDDDRYYAVLKNYPNQGMLTYKGIIFGELFCYQEQLPTMDWNLLDGDSIVCGYACQKAKVKFRGREWVVWYALDLPYSDGPWKLNGLPGVILKAQDAKGDFLFLAQKIAQVQFDRSELSTKRFKKTTAKDYAEDLILSYKDCFAFIEATRGIKTTVSIGGKTRQPTSKTACLLEYFDVDAKK